MAYFSDKPQIYFIAMFFMFVGATSFALHFIVVSRRKIKYYWQDVEFRFYVYYVLFLALIVSLTLILKQFYTSSPKAVLESFFQVVSFFFLFCSNKVKWTMKPGKSCRKPKKPLWKQSKQKTFDSIR